MLLSEIAVCVQRIAEVIAGAAQALAEETMQEAADIFHPYRATNQEAADYNPQAEPAMNTVCGNPFEEAYYRRRAALELAIQSHGNVHDWAAVIGAAQRYHRFLCGDDKIL